MVVGSEGEGRRGEREGGREREREGGMFYLDLSRYRYLSHKGARSLILTRLQLIQ